MKTLLATLQAFHSLICLSPYVTSKLAHLFTKSCSKRYANYEPSLVFSSKFSPTHGLQRLIQTQYCGGANPNPSIVHTFKCVAFHFPPFVFIKDLAPYPPQKFFSVVGYWHTNFSLGR